MPNNPYRNLPIEALCELLVSAVQDMLEAMEKKDEAAVNAKRKLVDILISNIREKKK